VYSIVFLGLLLFTDLARPEAAGWYAMLLEEGGYGRLQHERAAFLIRERSGTLTLQPWEDRSHRRATFRGTIPPRAIAVLHTHPRSDPRPSSGDRQQARRLGLPVVVITPQSVIAAMPDGSEVQLYATRMDRVAVSGR